MFHVALFAFFVLYAELNDEGISIFFFLACISKIDLCNQVIRATICQGRVANCDGASVNTAGEETPLWARCYHACIVSDASRPEQVREMAVPPPAWTTVANVGGWHPHRLVRPTGMPSPRAQSVIVPHPHFLPYSP
jgi:hypothetical protein